MRLKSFQFFFLSVIIMIMSSVTYAQNHNDHRRERKVRSAVGTSKRDTVFDYLRADNVTIGLKSLPILLAKEKDLSDEALSEREALENPAVDIYGEESWTRRVNPFTAIKPSVPDSFLVDCTSFVLPIDTMTRVTSGYGYRRRFGRMHYGVDIKLNIGDTVYAAFSGKVRMVDYERKGYGKYVVIRHPNGLETVYGHLSKHLVTEDQIVRAGEPIALGGNTGRSTGSHLHFETRFLGTPINPAEIFDFSEGGLPITPTYTVYKKKPKAARSNKFAVVGDADAAVHRVRNGDNLWDLARKYGTTVSHLCQLNGLTKSSVLRINQTLRVR